MTPFILCVDPGFSTSGWAILRLTPVSEHLHSVGIISTPKNKRDADTANEEMARTRTLFDAYRTLLRPPRAVPDGRFFAVVCEEFSMGAGHGGAMTARKMGFGHGALILAAHVCGLPLLHVSPSGARKHLGVSQTIVRGASEAEKKAKKTAGKLAAREAVQKRFPTVLGMTYGLRASALEHPYDAIAAGIACIADSDVIRMARLHAAG